MTPNQKNNLAVLSALVIAGALIWVYTINIVYTRINELRQNEAKQAQENQKTQQIAEIKNRLAQYNTTVETVISMLPDNDSFLSLVSFWESTALANNAAIKIDFEDPLKQGAKAPTQTQTENNKVDFTLELNGSQNDLISAISQIEKGRYFIDFKKINYVSRSDDGSMATAKLQGSVYVKNNFEK